MLHAHEFCLTVISHASFSEREGDWGSQGMFMPGMVKKDREREKSHAGHATQSSIGIVLLGMKMSEMSCKKVQIRLCLRNSPSYLKKNILYLTKFMPDTKSYAIDPN